MSSRVSVEATETLDEACEAGLLIPLGLGSQGIDGKLGGSTLPKGQSHVDQLSPITTFTGHGPESVEDTLGGLQAGVKVIPLEDFKGAVPQHFWVRLAAPEFVSNRGRYPCSLVECSCSCTSSYFSSFVDVQTNEGQSLIELILSQCKQLRPFPIVNRLHGLCNESNDSFGVLILVLAYNKGLC